jgi:hypothetical protein
MSGHASRVAVSGLATLTLVLSMVWLSLAFGATWDEPQQRQKAHQLLSYWHGSSPTLDVPDDGAHLYGAPLDVVAAWLEPHLAEDPYVIRHAVIATAASLGVIFTWLLAMRLFGQAEAALAVALTLSSPFFVAHATNNPKDLPFAVVGVAWLLMLARLPAREPLSRPRHLLGLALILGVGLNVRAGALLFFGYLVVFVFLRALRGGEPLLRATRILAPRLLVVLVGGVATGWLAWPWAYDQPLTAPFRGLAMLSRFPWGGEVLFDGVSYSGFDVPHAYVARWFWMTLPPVVTLGAVSSLWLLRTSQQSQAIALWSVVLFPVLYVTGTRATLYDGVRHLLFVVPPLMILAAAGLVHLWRRAPGRGRWLVAGVVGVGLLEPLVFQVRNHPNQSAYIQPLAGGPRAAFARYDLDYWGNCVLEGLRRAAALPGEPPVHVTGWPYIVLEANAPRVAGITLVREQDGRARRAVRLVRGTREAVWNASNARDVISRVETHDGAVLCVVVALDERAESR